MNNMISSLFIDNLEVNFSNESWWFLFLSKYQKNSFFFPFLCNNYCPTRKWVPFLSGVYCHFSPLLPYRNFFQIILLCYHILTILLTLVASTRLWLIIRSISSRLWLIIRWIMLYTTFLIVILFSFTKMMCLWNFYILANLWNISTDCWQSADDSNIFIFNR